MKRTVGIVTIPETNSYFIFNQENILRPNKCHHVAVQVCCSLLGSVVKR